MSERTPSLAPQAPEFTENSASALQKGRAAESQVSRYLTDRGLLVIAHNLRVGRDELDIVALQKNTLVVVEVRSRRKNSMVHPLLSLKPDKLDRLRRASLRLMLERGALELRIDVASVIDGEVEYIENAVDFSEK